MSFPRKEPDNINKAYKAPRTFAGIPVSALGVRPVVPKVEVVLQNNAATPSRPARSTHTHSLATSPTARTSPHTSFRNQTHLHDAAGNPLARNALHTLTASAQVIHNLDSPFFFRPENWKSPQFRGKGKESLSTNYVQQTLPTSFSQGNTVSAGRKCLKVSWTFAQVPESVYDICRSVCKCLRHLPNCQQCL